LPTSNNAPAFNLLRPAENVDQAVAYYVTSLGFSLDWGDDDGGIDGNFIRASTISTAAPETKKGRLSSPRGGKPA